MERGIKEAREDPTSRDISKNNIIYCCVDTCIQYNTTVESLCIISIHKYNMYMYIHTTYTDMRMCSDVKRVPYSFCKAQ